MMRKKHLSLILKLAIVGVIFFFLFRNVYTNWDKIRDYDWRPNYLYLVLSAVTLFCFNFFRGWVWGLIVRLVHPGFPLKKGIWVWLVSSFGRYIPGKIWLFLGKVYLSMEEGVSRKNATVAVMLEFAITVISAMLMTLAFLPFLPRIGDFINPVYYVVLIPLGLLSLHARSMDFIIQVLAKLTRREAGPVRYPYWQVLLTFTVFCLTWLWFVFGIFLMYKALTGIPFSAYGVFACVIPLSMVLGLVAAFAPDGLGVREVVLCKGLEAIMPFSVAAVLVVIQRLWTTGIDLLTLGVMMAVNGRGIRKLLAPFKDGSAVLGRDTPEKTTSSGALPSPRGRR